VIIESTIQKTRELVGSWRKDGQSICLVPTMGYFHDGHLALMQEGTRLADKVIVSLFVNPTQFGPNEDLENYPRDPEGDAAKAKQAGVDLIFCPNVSDMYLDEDQTVVSVEELSKGMCGDDRPGHFSGVTTVVCKLFNILQPDCAIFGEKDLQQLLVIKQMARDLHFPVRIIGHEIVREHDGLAMSSRNAYLNSQERESALVLFSALQMIKKRVEETQEHLKSAPLIEESCRMINKQTGCSVDYLTVVDEETLQAKERIKGNCRVAGAIKINDRIRLIDNISVRS